MLKSIIWQHFTEIDSEKKVTCLYCSQQMSVANKSTCTLIRHLTKKHPTVKIRRHSSNEGQCSREEVLLVNNDDTDVNPHSPDATILEYEFDESEAEGNDEIDYKLSQKIHKSNIRNIDNSSAVKKEHEHNVIAAMNGVKKQIQDAVISMKTLTRKTQRNQDDEYDLFGQVLASKIRKIRDVDKRETVMHSLYNVVYEALMKND